MVISAPGEAFRIQISPAGQVLGCIAAFLLFLWMTVATAVTLAQGLGRPETAARPLGSAGDGFSGQSGSFEQLIESTRILERQVAAALELADIALEDKMQLELALAGLRQTPHPESAAAGAGPANGEDIDGDARVRQLLLALETAIDDLSAAREELNAEREKNSELLDSAEISREKARRTIARLTDAITLATEGLESLFRRLGLNPDQLTRDIQATYSGAGGLAVYIDDISIDSSDDQSHFRASDVQQILQAVDRLNVGRLAHQSLPLGHPVKRANRFTSGFGMRIHPVRKVRDFHAGADFAAPSGTAIHATGDGVVTFTGWRGAYGRTVIIRHAGGVETLYAHLSKIRVKRGDRVWRNQHIADMGSTGVSTAPHLHYEVRLGEQAVNPMQFIKAD